VSPITRPSQIMATKLKTVEQVLDDLPGSHGALTKLRQPFPAHQISKLPKPYKKDSPKVNCSECGGYHGLPAMHLDYVGHAALTDRLLDTDSEWSWEPVGFTPEGLPALDRNGGLWIKLTVCGVTRYGYGAADGKSGGDAMKEMIGDALRNAAMRFGAALDLWHKGDLHLEDETDTGETGDNFISQDQRDDLEALASEVGADLQRFCKYLGVKTLSCISADGYDAAVEALEAKRKPKGENALKQQLEQSLETAK
jgi:hypothetical protein